MTSTSSNSEGKDKTTVITVRISNDLDSGLAKIAEERNIPKAVVIREYLDKSRYFLIDHNSIKSFNKNNLMVLKRRYFKKIMEEFEERKQIELATELARFINDLARLEGKSDDVLYKLNLCEEYGFFSRYMDAEGYILISKRFGPQRFVEAFTWYLITMGNEGDFSLDFTTEEINDNSRIEKRYKKDIQPVRRDATHYAFEFAKLKDSDDKEGEKEGEKEKEKE